MNDRTSPKKAAIDFYFDFLSPFSYLAHHRLMGVVARFDLDISYWPLELARAKLAIGNNGPTNRDLPIKLAYLTKDLDRWAERLGLPLIFPPGFATNLMNSGTFYARQKGCEADYVRRAYHLVWGLGRAPDDAQVLRTLAREMGWDEDAFLTFIRSEEARRAYDLSTETAIENHIFGVPSMCYGGQTWWGNDRVDFLEEFLEKNL